LSWAGSGRQFVGHTCLPKRAGPSVPATDFWSVGRRLSS
jgi:hypothetical protein